MSPTPAYTKEFHIASFGEQDMQNWVGAAGIETPVPATKWIGKIRGIGGHGIKAKLEQHYFSGGGRIPFENVDLGVDIDGVSLAYEVQDWALVVLAFGHVEDVGSSPTNATTLTATANPGDLTITVASAAGYATNDRVQVGSGAQKPEVRIVAGVAGSVITLDKKLRRKHASGDAVNEVTSPFTHTIKVGDDFPIPWTLQSVFRAGLTDELAMQFAGMHTQELTFEQAERDLLLATHTIGGSKPVDVAPPASVPAKVLTGSYKFAQAVYTYFSVPLNGVLTHRTRLRSGGQMQPWSRGDANAFYAAEYIPERAIFEHDISVINRNDDIWDQILLRAVNLSANIVYTRGANDTATFQMTNCGLIEAPADVPDTGKVTVPMRIMPGDFQIVVVDLTPYH